MIGECSLRQEKEEITLGKQEIIFDFDKDEKSQDYLDMLRMRALKRGKIYLLDDVEIEVAERICFEIEEAQIAGVKELHVIIGSPGGNVFAGLAIFDALQEYREKGGKVITEARGYAASMGAILLQAGDERTARRNARILIHEVRTFGWGVDTASQSEEKAKEMKKVNMQLVKILSERSGNSEKMILRLIKKRDYWVSADEALNINLIDKIV